MMVVAMNHHGRGFGPSFWTWLILGGVLLVIGIVGLVSYFRGRQSDSLSRKERGELNAMQAEILALIRQNGGPILQTELGDTLPYDVEDIAGVVKELESKSLLQREWKSEQQTYEIAAC